MGLLAESFLPPLRLLQSTSLPAAENKRAHIRYEYGGGGGSCLQLAWGSSVGLQESEEAAADRQRHIGFVLPQVFSGLEALRDSAIMAQARLLFPCYSST